MRLCSLLCFSEIVWHTKKHRQLHSIKNKRDPKYLKGLCHAIILLPLAIFFSTHQLNSKNSDPGLLFYTILGTETIFATDGKNGFTQFETAKITNKSSS